jgi:hypothetical protein
MRELAYRGIPFDPADDRTLAQPFEEIVNEDFAAQDRQAARSERARMIEAGLLHDLGPAYPEPSPAPESSGGSAPVPAARSRIVDKCRELLHRGGAVPCCCPSCVSVRADRGA